MHEYLGANSYTIDFLHSLDFSRAEISCVYFYDSLARLDVDAFLFGARPAPSDNQDT